MTAIKNFLDYELVEQLKTIRGVGYKIANCVALFAYHLIYRAPVDVWIKHTIDEDFAGKNIFDAFGANAGILRLLSQAIDRHDAI